MQRLEQLKELLAKADPEKDKLYIEDLKESIKYQESVDKNRYSTGFELTEKE
jgi:hypothetical protein